MSRGQPSADNSAGGASEAIRLHIGGVEAKAGWKILNIQPGPYVDYVGNCRDLSRFPDNSIDQIYASHVYEHLDYMNELMPALAEAWRVLKPGGVLMISVPDLSVLCRLFLHQDLTMADRLEVMRIMFGGQIDEFDYHKVGLSEEFLLEMLRLAKFSAARRVEGFGLFNDNSTCRFAGVLISLNVIATK